VVTSLAKQLAEKYMNLPSGSVVDLHDEMRFLTLEAVSEASFSLHLGLLKEEKGEEVVYDYGDVKDRGEKDGKRKTFTGQRMDYLVREGFVLMGKAMRFPIPGAHRLGLNFPYRYVCVCVRCKCLCEINKILKK
jgi:hypothetical protein